MLLSLRPRAARRFVPPCLALLCCGAALVAAPLAISGCGSGSGEQAAPPRPVERAARFLVAEDLAQTYTLPGPVVPGAPVTLTYRSFLLYNGGSGVSNLDAPGEPIRLVEGVDYQFDPATGSFRLLRRLTPPPASSGSGSLLNDILNSWGVEVRYTALVDGASPER